MPKSTIAAGTVVVASIVPRPIASTTSFGGMSTGTMPSSLTV